MTAETDLLPCPFCGSENIDPKGWASTDSAGPACDDCGACAGGVRGTLQDNIAAWNRRAQAAEIEALRAEVERANSWNERVSVCRDHVADIVDGPCVICALGAAEARADKLAEALKEIRSRSAMNLAMHPNPFELTARLGDIYQIADATLSKENSND